MGPRRRAIFVHTPETSLDGDLPLAAAHLVATGCSVAILTDFAEARIYIREMSPRLVVTNLRLGAYNGLHLVIAARAARDDAAAVVIADAADEPLRGEAERLGATFLLRPLSSDLLYEVIARRMDGRTREPPPPAYAGG